jgi:hypothetical protein
VSGGGMDGRRRRRAGGRNRRRRAGAGEDWGKFCPRVAVAVRVELSGRVRPVKERN